MEERATSDDTARTILEAGLFQQEFYEQQRSDRFRTEREALHDFLGEGLSRGLSPHPLFDVAFYLRKNADVGPTGANPVLHYLVSGWQEGRDPHPLFDTDFYASQVGDLRGLSPLSHFLRHAGRARNRPNRLFDTECYLRQSDDVARAGVNPLEHYIRYGRDEGRAPSEALRPLLAAWRRPSNLSLARGAWRRPQTLWLESHDADPSGAPIVLLQMLEELIVRLHFDVKVVLSLDGPLRKDFEHLARTVCLDHYGAHSVDNPEFRPSTLRMLLFSLVGPGPEAALCAPLSSTQVGEAFADLGVPVVALARDVPDAEFPPAGFSATAYVDRLLERAPLGLAPSSRTAASRGRIIAVCKDWSISGVHTVVEALGRELLRRGWDFRILFTRGTVGVLDGMAATVLPGIPYEFLDVSLSHGLREHWVAIIRHLELHAPCVLLSTFDDVANAVAPALTDRVGVVGWLQSDETHYYESAYRLGRYWNAIACVSRCIADKVKELNPSFEERTRLIHNAVVGRDDVIGSRGFLEDGRLRLVYVGRLVQYQKRALDFTRLAREMDRAGIDYRLTLIGASEPGDVEAALEQELAGHVAAGTLRLTGRLSRAEVFRELAASDVFVLLSDFEGCPVAMLEAMACGCVPVVSRMESGIPEILRHDENGLVMEGRDYAQWAGALDDLRKDEPRLGRLSGAARLTVADRFCTEIMADRFEAIFSQVLDEIGQGRYARPPALTWQNRFDDVLLPPFLQGRLVE